MRNSRRLWKPSSIGKIVKRKYSADKPYYNALGILPECYGAQPLENQAVDTARPYSEIPGPKGLSFFGNSWRFAPLIGHYKIEELDKVMWSLRKEYGKMVKLSGLIGHPDFLFIFDGDNIKDVFKREEGMPHRPSTPSLHYYKGHLQKEFFDGNAGIIGVHGPKWEHFRKQVQHILLPPSTTKKYVEPLDEIATDFLKRMQESLDENKELPENFLSEIYKWALESVARVCLDTRLGCLTPNLPKDCESQRIIDLINVFFYNAAEVELKMPVWRIYKNKAFRKYIGALEDFRTVCMKYIVQRMDNMDIKNLRQRKEEDVSIVEEILIKTKNPKLAAVLALDLLLVGVDTTSIAAASTIYQLSQNPEKQETLFQELQSIMPYPDSKVTVATHENMPFLKACIKETLRMFPVIMLNGRSLQSDAVISGFRVPKGTHVIFPHLVVSNSEEYFPNPEKFLPERWLKTKSYEGCPINKTKIHQFVSLPFGYGRRSCLGRRFAEAELQILLSKIFRKYKVEYNYDPLTYKITPTYAPEQPLKFKLSERQ